MLPVPKLIGRYYSVREPKEISGGILMWILRWRVTILFFSDLVSLNTKFEESEVPFDIDLLIRANITNQNLENQIAKHGTEFYRKNRNSS